MDTNTILKEIQKQNHFVYKKFFNEMYTDMVNYAYRYLFDTNQSKDIAQEVFIHLWENSTNIKHGTNLKGYLLVMVRNKCLNHLKSTNITDQLEFIELQYILDKEKQIDLFITDEKKEKHNKVLKIVENLPEKMKEIVNLKFRSDFTYKEIAEELDISLNTVKTQLKRAKTKIVQQIVMLIITFIFFY